jgi:hypothetical protein
MPKDNSNTDNNAKRKKELKLYERFIRNNDRWLQRIAEAMAKDYDDIMSKSSQLYNDDEN